MLCGAVSEVSVEDSAYHAWFMGKHIQHAFPDMSAEKREVLLGVCEKCQVSVYGNDTEEEEAAS